MIEVRGKQVPCQHVNGDRFVLASSTFTLAEVQTSHPAFSFSLLPRQFCGVWLRAVSKSNCIIAAYRVFFSPRRTSAAYRMFLHLRGGCTSVEDVIDDGSIASFQALALDDAEMPSTSEDDTGGETDRRRGHRGGSMTSSHWQGSLMMHSTHSHCHQQKQHQQQCQCHQ